MYLDNGEQIQPSPSLADIKNRFKREMAWLPVGSNPF